MRQEEIELVETSVVGELMPEIKSAMPKIIGFILRAIFPKIEKRIIMFITGLIQAILLKRELR